MSTISIILNILLISTINNKIIVIPFEKRNEITESHSIQEVFDLLKDNVLKIKYSIGTPSTELILHPKSQIEISYVASEKSYFEQKPKYLKEYKNSSSSTFKLLDKEVYSFGIEVNEGYYMTETINISNNVIDKVCLIQGVDFTGSTLKFDSGVLGLGRPVPKTVLDYDSNFITQLKTKKIIDNYNYFIEYTDTNKGNIIIGASPNTYNKEKYPDIINSTAKVPTQKDMYIAWGFKINNITYENGQYQNFATYSIIKVEYGFISANRVLFSLLNESFFGELIVNNICEIVNLPNNDTSFVCKKGKFDKSKLKKLHIYSQELDKEFIIDLSKLFYDIGDKSFFLVTFYYFFDYYIILGEPFLKEYIIVYNQDTKSVSSYTYFKKNSKKVKKMFIK